MRAAFLLVRAKRYGMKTININGKEYTKDEFLKENKGLDAFLDYWDWEEAVNSSFDAIFKFPRHEPEPPTLRPMSELPEEKFGRFLFKMETKGGSVRFEIGTVNEYNHLQEDMEFCVNTGTYQDYFKRDQFKGTNRATGAHLIGWLPLPNPNEIKL